MKNYLLVLEKRPFDYMPININLLDLIDNSKVYNSIKDIDDFTKQYTKKQIIDSIINANIVTSEYLTGDLLIIEIINNNKKYLHKYKALTKDIINDFDLIKFIYTNINNKNILNSISVKLQNLIEKEDEELLILFKDSVNKKNVKDIVKILFFLPYEYQREIDLYLIEKYHNLEKNELKRRKTV